MAIRLSSRRMRDLSSTFNWERVMNWPAKPATSVLELRTETGRVNAELSKYATPPTPIDWDSYKKKMHDPFIVDLIKKDYEHDIATFKLCALEDMYDVEAAEKGFKDMINSCNAEVDESREEIKKLEHQLATLKRLYTTRETTVKEVLEAYPELQKQIDEEIANHEWEKGTI